MKEFYGKLHNIIKNSKAVAYTYYGQTHSYTELYRDMLKVNSVLRNYRNERVALFSSKHFHAYSAIFSIILSGNVWIPFTPEVPEGRNLDIMKLAEPKLIITDRRLPVSLAEYAKNKGIAVVELEKVMAENNIAEFALGHFNKDDIAYIMFTSGSTGIPKGVPMTHENYINFINNAMNILPFKQNEVFSDFHDFAFDISIFYLFCCILTESAFAPIIKTEDTIIPINHIIKNNVTVWSSVPSVISRLKRFKRDDLIQTPVRIMFLCGEPFRLDVLEYCFKNLRLENVYDFYGLTETGVENFYHKCHPDDLVEYRDIGFVPIGKPLKGNQIRITEEKELMLSGCQVTPGYLGGISSEKFEIIDGIRWYHTGDIVVKYKDVYFCKGRLDSQVKLSGYRVELMDIETYIRRIDGIDEAVCFIESIDEKMLLIAAVKARNKIGLRDIQDNLKFHLPNYMIPRDILYLDNVPLNKNGKINRKKVQQMYVKKALIP
ncbi:MAG: AMP-binding protein [Candidatus Omnitrophota bacterium]|nr:MAG: AMP-binding protein [Candidatus Omnitrophota bacterium]